MLTREGRRERIEIVRGPDIAARERNLRGVDVGERRAEQRPRCDQDALRHPSVGGELAARDRHQAATADRDLVLAGDLGRTLALFADQRPQSRPRPDRCVRRDVRCRKRARDCLEKIGRVRARDRRLLERALVDGVRRTDVDVGAARHREDRTPIARAHDDAMSCRQIDGAKHEVDAFRQLQRRRPRGAVEGEDAVDPRTRRVHDDGRAERERRAALVVTKLDGAPLCRLAERGHAGVVRD